VVYEIPPTRQQQLEGGPALQADRQTEHQLASFLAYWWAKSNYFSPFHKHLRSTVSRKTLSRNINGKGWSNL
jgi:hypothetical protein